jgi:hypothetical protein
MTAATATIKSIAAFGSLLVQRGIRQPDIHVGERFQFADGTAARVYRETVVEGRVLQSPCVLFVAFRLRLIRGHGRAHALFRAESLLNTPLFVGYPGFVSKLWLAHDERNVYRGIYQWDGPDQAEHYARCLWRILAIGSVRDSITYRVVSDMRLDDLLDDPHLLDAIAPEQESMWWRIRSMQ